MNIGASCSYTTHLALIQPLCFDSLMQLYRLVLYLAVKDVHDDFVPSYVFGFSIDCSIRSYVEVKVSSKVNLLYIFFKGNLNFKFQIWSTNRYPYIHL